MGGPEKRYGGCAQGVLSLILKLTQSAMRVELGSHGIDLFVFTDLAILFPNICFGGGFFYILLIRVGDSPEDMIYLLIAMPWILIRRAIRLSRNV